MTDLSPPPSKPGAWSELRSLLEGLSLPGSVAAVVAMVSLVISHYQGDTSFFRTHFGSRFSGVQAELFPYTYWHLASFALYFLLPVAAAALTPGQRVRDTGIGLGDARTGLKVSGLILAAFLPIVAIASKLPAFAGHYPLCGAATSSWGAYFTYAAGFALYFIGWEYLFRGYLLFALEPTMGKMAVFAQTLPFVVLHSGKPQLECLGSIIAGVFLGMLALRTRSFWYGALIHICVACSMDLLTGWERLTK